MPNHYAISEVLHHRAAKVIPGGVSSNNRANWQPHPLFYSRAEGAYVWDVDENCYTDYVLGRGPLITGHSHPRILDAIHRQYRAGQFFAGQTELEVVLAEKINSLVPGAEMLRFCNSGSEAVHVALRLARSVTGREKIIRFEGHYHGWFDNIAWGFAAPLSSAKDTGALLAMSMGQPASDTQNIISLCWNHIEALENLLADKFNEIAAVIAEPIMFNSFWSNILPEDNFLTRVKALCDKYHVLLIFDEIQTGFRTAIGGAQAYYGVTPDISTFAKALGGPVCLAAVAGKADYMRLLAGAKTLHTGTYNAFPPSLAGALMNVAMLAENDGARLKHIHQMSAALQMGLRHIAEGSALPMQVRSSPGAVTTTFRATPIIARDYRTARHEIDEQLVFAWHAALQEKGIRITPEGLWYVSCAHSDADIKHTLEKAAEAMISLEHAGRGS